MTGGKNVAVTHGPSWSDWGTDGETAMRSAATLRQLADEQGVEVVIRQAVKSRLFAGERAERLSYWARLLGYALGMPRDSHLKVEEAEVILMGLAQQALSVGGAVLELPEEEKA